MAALGKSYPVYAVQIGALHYDITHNRLDCDSVSVVNIDSGVSCRLARISFIDIDRTRLLKGEALNTESLSSMVIEVEGIEMMFARFQYVLYGAHLRISAADSSLLAEHVEVHPQMDDAAFFAASNFRRTRFISSVSRCSISSMDYEGLVQERSFRFRFAQVDDAALSVLIDKDKPDKVTPSIPPMPYAILATIKESLMIDSICVTNGSLAYSEQFRAGAKPATITCDSVRVTADHIGNSEEIADTAVIQAQGVLMNSAPINMMISMPLGSPQLSFLYSGSVGTMKMDKFNPFLEIAEHKRVKTGMLYGASFDIAVVDGRATGNVKAQYEDLKLSAIDGPNGSEGGILNRLGSIIANNMRLRTTSMADKSGSMKIGFVRYEKKPYETFFSFAWIAIRSGLADIVGF
ncbi:MAG TPA: hypothetical protein VKS81_10630 [Bacteroidota bacterium]|nr:hypothetical protein [Bacteroidota bacterium]